MKKLRHLGLSILMSALLASCGGTSGGTTDEFTPSLNKDADCAIKVVGDYSNFEALEAEFDKFNVYYPNVRLSYTKIDKYEDNLPTVLAGSEKPNIFFSHPKMIGNDKYSSIVSHMEDLSDSKLKLNLNYIRSSLLNKDVDGKVFMVPVFSRTYGALVNKDLFQKESINFPTKWTDLLSTCKALAGKGYQSPMMGYTNYDKNGKPTNGLMNTIAYPLFIAELAKNPSALALANNLDPQAGQYMRGALETVKAVIDEGCASIEECDKISDNYEKVLLRFFEGDVPMMLCNGDTVSGTKKREAKSEAFTNHPFNYAFYPLPATEQGGYFIDSPSIEFSINKNCENLDMTNEFMKFLIRTSELNDMAAAKGLISPTKANPFAPVYAPFNDVPAERIISPEVIGVKDSLANQIRNASFLVGRGDLTVDEAIARYGSL